MRTRQLNKMSGAASGRRCVCVAAGSLLLLLLADVSQTPRWLARCTGIEVLTPGPLAVGSKLRYSYKEGSRRGVMDECEARTQGALVAGGYGCD